jgi:hypothetical protein
MKWAEHVACMGAERGTQGFGEETVEKTAFEKKTCGDGRMILKRIFRKQDDRGRCGLDCCGTG